jgi:hypothetical protein
VCPGLESSVVRLRTAAPTVSSEDSRVRSQGVLPGPFTCVSAQSLRFQRMTLGIDAGATSFKLRTWFDAIGIDQLHFSMIERFALS